MPYLVEPNGVVIGYRGDPRSMAQAPVYRAMLGAMLRSLCSHDEIERRFPGLAAAVGVDWRKYPASAPGGRTLPVVVETPSPAKVDGRSRHSAQDRVRIMREYDEAVTRRRGAQYLREAGVTRAAIAQWRRKRETQDLPSA
jgi:hypothetical protein